MFFLPTYLGSLPKMATTQLSRFLCFTSKNVPHPLYRWSETRLEGKERKEGSKSMCPSSCYQPSVIHLTESPYTRCQIANPIHQVYLHNIGKLFREEGKRKNGSCDWENIVGPAELSFSKGSGNENWRWGKQKIAGNF